MIQELRAENQELRKKLESSGGKKRKLSSSSEDEAEKGEERAPATAANEPVEVVIIDEGQTKDMKWRLIEAAVPLSSNEGFLNVLADEEGRDIMSKLLDQDIRRLALFEGIEFDTTPTEKGETRPTRQLASSLIHAIFSNDYIEAYKFYDPRENYKQKEGTAMAEEVYVWFESVITESVAEVHRMRGRDNPFVWDEFLSLDLRTVWRWTRSNITKSKNRLARQKARRHE